MNVVRSEWTKLRSVRSTWVLALGTVVASVAVGLLGVAGQVGDAQAQLPADWDPTAESLKGLLVGQLLIGVLGASAMAAEYATGMIVVSLAVVPDRARLLGAKVAVVVALTSVVAVLTVGATFLGGQAIIGGAGLPTASLEDPPVLRALLGGVVYLVAVASIGLSVATLTRSASGALGVLVALALLGPALTPALPGAVGEAIATYWPLAAGQAGYTVVRVADGVAPGAGLAIGVVFAGGVLVAARVALRRRHA
jgi:ABC-type transport system involved in multi-copper enzyme maturation permease subunit